MNTFFRLSALSIIALTLNSCGYGYSTTERFTPFDPSQKDIKCNYIPEKVDLYFEGEKIDFEYEKLGVIEVTGQQYANDAEMLEKLKKLAKEKCCDAIINLKRGYVDRERGMAFSSEPTEKYSAITYFGLGVKKRS